MCELVSVVMSVYNEPVDYVTKAIESILNQTWENIEFIIVMDNPSNAELGELIKSYGAQYNNIFIMENEKNMGLPYSLNRAISKASGKYIARMDADDISFPERIEEEVLFLKKNNYDMVASNRIDIDEEGNIIRKGRKVVRTEKVSKILPSVCVITHPSVLIKADIIKEMGGYRYFRTSQDYDLWLRMKTEGKRIGIEEKELIYYRIRSESIGNKDNFLQRLMTEYIQLLYKERKKKRNGSDSFSKENLEKFLVGNKYYDVMEKKKYICAKNDFEEGIQEIKYRNFFKGVRKIIKSCRNRHIRKQVIGLIIMNSIK